jgi:hypothetical protein
MAFKTNYRQKRTDRVRAKEQKKLEKLQRRQEASALRQATREAQQVADDEPKSG